jgi:hypothetical protein
MTRRHMTAGQRAMAVAMIHPEPEKGGRGKRLNYSTDFDKGYLSQARTVLRLDRPLADAVLVERGKATQAEDVGVWVVS